MSGPAMDLKVVLRTDVGKVRSENQDYAVTTSAEELDPESRGRLMVVADGMGGHRGGATASRLAATTIKDAFLASESSDVREILQSSLTAANRRIFESSQANPDLRGMGTTCSALVVHGSTAWFAHVGDSRIYLVRNQEIRQLTDDHSLVASMVREGLLTAAEAEIHPRRNVLQRSMGVSQDVEIDVSQAFTVIPGDTFILCSDGLHGVVRDEEIRTIAAMPISAAADQLLARALERGAPDNVTVIVARVVEAGTTAEDEDAHEALASVPSLPTAHSVTGGRIILWLILLLVLVVCIGASLYLLNDVPASTRR